METRKRQSTKVSQAKAAIIIAAATLLSTFAGRVWVVGEFYERRAEGWFWYQQDPLAAETTTAEQRDDSADIEPTKQSAMLVPLSAAWFRENFSKFRDAAIDNPTPENISAYLYLQRVMLDKSSRFSDRVQQAVITDAYLDEVTRRPLATFAANEMNREAGHAREAQLRAVAKQAGIFFFFQSDCRFCDIQAPILASLADRFGFEIFPISLDGRAMPNGLFPNFRIDQGQARDLGVLSAPAMFLARPPDKTIQIAQGVISMDELVNRILLVALQAGWLEQREYEQTRPISAQVAFDGMSLPSEAFSDPKMLVEFLREKVRVKP